MGTRHLTKVTYQGKNVIAQYGQWDGYPTGQGVTVGEFLSQSYWVGRLKENIEKGALAFLNQEEYEALRKVLFEDHKDTPVGGALVSMFLGSQFCRDCGAQVLMRAARHGWYEGKFYTTDESDFEEDTLFCEFVHHLDMDSETYTIYRPGDYDKDGNLYAISWSFSEFKDKTHEEIVSMMQDAEAKIWPSEE